MTVQGVAFTDVLDLLRKAARPLQLTFSVPQDVKAHEQAAVALSEREQRVEKLRAQPQQLQTEAAQELKQGELLKLEKTSAFFQEILKKN